MLKGSLAVGLALCFVFLSASPVLSGIDEGNSSVLVPVEVSFYYGKKQCSEVVALSESELEALRYRLGEFDFSSAVGLVESCGSLPVGFMKQDFVSEVEQMSAKCSSFESVSCVLNASTYVNSMCMVKYQTSYFTYSLPQLPIRLVLTLLGGISSLIPLALIFFVFVQSGGFPSGTIVDDLFDVLFLCLGVAAWGAFGPFYLSPIQLANSFISLRLGWEDPVSLSTTGIAKSWEVSGLIESLAIIGFTGATISVVDEEIPPFKNYELYGCAGLVCASGVVE